MAGVFREYIVKPLTRSRGWSKLRRQFVREHPFCAACGRKKRLQVHHIQDFSEYPELELEFTNLTTLCSRCHLYFGHLLSWKSINPHVISDSTWFSDKVLNRR
jgi:5-methylcytosine-specific restriction endonuclease McrA